MADHKKRSLVMALAGTGSAVAGSAVLPGRWKQPVIDSVVLPAHAQTSVAVPDGTWEGTLTFTGVDSNGSIQSDGNDSTQSIGQLVLNALIPPAHACLRGDLLFRIQVIDQQLTLLVEGNVLAALALDALVFELTGVEILGQLSDVRGEYDPDSDKWNVFVRGQDNAFACAGNDANGVLQRSGP